MAHVRRHALSLVHRVRAPGVGAGAGRRVPLLLLLHGVGSNELAMAALAGSFDPRFLVVSVRAPGELAPFAFAWLHENFTAHGPTIDPADAAAATTAITRFIDEAIDAYEVDPARVYVAGFSQGGIVALATLLTAPEQVSGVVSMSGRLPPEVLPHVVSPDLLEGKRVLIVHGTGDETIQVAHGRTAFATLNELPLAVDYLEFDMGHTTTDESVSAVSAWLSARLAS
jgi:phospholipase/carboxylesterase